MDGGGTILMAHHPSVRHKYIHTNGAPRPGAPLVFFLFLLEPTGYLPPDLIHIKFPLLARLVSSQFSHQEVLGSIPRLHNFFSFKILIYGQKIKVIQMVKKLPWYGTNKN